MIQIQVLLYLLKLTLGPFTPRRLSKYPDHLGRMRLATPNIISSAALLRLLHFEQWDMVLYLLLVCYHRGVQQRVRWAVIRLERPKDYFARFPLAHANCLTP